MGTLRASNSRRVLSDQYGRKSSMVRVIHFTPSYCQIHQSPERRDFIAQAFAQIGVRGGSEPVEKSIPLNWSLLPTRPWGAHESGTSSQERFRVFHEHVRNPEVSVHRIPKHG
jgi:hypothetical protein